MIRPLLIGLAAALSLCSGARSELAVLANGDVLKIVGFELKGERMQLTLKGGGSLTLPIGRIERIVDDEILEPPPPPPQASPQRHQFRVGEVVPATPYSELIFETGRRFGLNPHLLAAVARAESAFDAGALSPKGARGLLQLMPATAARFGVDAAELWDPEHNLEAGARYLEWLASRFNGDLRLILAAYNAGEGAVAKYGGVPPYRETVEYVERVLGYLASSAGEVNG